MVQTMNIQYKLHISNSITTISTVMNVEYSLQACELNNNCDKLMIHDSTIQGVVVMNIWLFVYIHIYSDYYTYLPHTDTQRHRNTQIHIDTHRDTDTQRHRHTQIHRRRHTETQTHTDTHRHRHTDTHRYI